MPHNRVYADGSRCAPVRGPFTAAYSFLERATFIPGHFANSVWRDDVARALVTAFMNRTVVRDGGRAFFGFDANARTCGRYKFPGDAGNMTTLTMFYAAKTAFTHPVLGKVEANNKHLAIVVRNTTHSLYRCIYMGPVPNSSPSPTPTVSATVSPSASASSSATPSASPSPGSSVSPSPSPSASTSALAPSAPSLASGPLGVSGANTPSAGSTCFPADESVELQNGTVIPMERLSVGDRVLVAPHTYSTVFMFTHKVGRGRYDFLRFTLADGSVLRMTPSHYAYADGVATAARDVRVGQRMDIAARRDGTVVKVDITTARGLYNPQTVHGDIVVSGVRATTYTGTVPMYAAHGLLTPLRFLYGYAGVKVRMFEDD